jgi:hypothetical protein
MRVCPLCTLRPCYPKIHRTVHPLSHLCLDFPSGLLLSGFLIKILYAFLIFSMPCPSQINVYKENKIIKFNAELFVSVHFTHGVHQGCPLSSCLFNIYLNEILHKWEIEKQKEYTFQEINFSRTSLCRRPSNNVKFRR